MLISLSGTPGTGKTTVAELLSSAGYRIIPMNELTKKFLVGRDAGRESDEVDMEALIESMDIGKFLTSNDIETHKIIEGHLSHLLPVDIIVVLRTSPRVLKERLASRGYSPEKVRENMEAEALGVITIEALEVGIPVYEIDTTEMSPEETARRLTKIVEETEDEHEKEKALRADEKNDSLSGQTGTGVSRENDSGRERQKRLRPEEIIDFTEEIMEWY